MASTGGEGQFREAQENVGSYNSASEVVGDSNNMAHQDTTNAAVREDGMQRVSSSNKTTRRAHDGFVGNKHALINILLVSF